MGSKQKPSKVELAIYVVIAILFALLISQVIFHQFKSNVLPTSPKIPSDSPSNNSSSNNNEQNESGNNSNATDNENNETINSPTGSTTDNSTEQSSSNTNNQSSSVNGGTNPSVSDNQIDSKDKLSQLIYHGNLALKEIENGKGKALPILVGDFIQPWYCDEFSPSVWDRHLKMLKSAGIDYLVLQWTVELKDGKIIYLGYESQLRNDSSLIHADFSNYVYNYSRNLLGNLLSAAKNNGIKVHIGLTIGNDWWNEAFVDPNWRSSVSNITQKVAKEIYTNYVVPYRDTVVGWYWPWEMYTSVAKHEVNWVEMLNSDLGYLTRLDPSLPLMIAPFVSSYENASLDRAYAQWVWLIEKTNFRRGDMLYLQDSLGNTPLPISKAIEYIVAIERATRHDSNLGFGLIMENFLSNSSRPATSLDYFIPILRIGAVHSSSLYSFSYSHYYNPLDEQVGTSYDKAYREYASKYNPKISPLSSSSQSTQTNSKDDQVSSSQSSLDGGLEFYVDNNGNKAPIPKGFKVSSNPNERSIDKGLVIIDSFGNEFVWIPIADGIGIDGRYDRKLERGMVMYKKWSDYGVNFGDVIDDSIKGGVDEWAQVAKYGGFYIGRYESVFDYNGGNPRVKVTKSNGYTVENWSYIRNENFNGYLWNFIPYLDAKRYAENMAASYNYTGIKTGLVTGTQWDSVARWLEVSEYNVLDSSSWGNYLSPSLVNTGSVNAYKANNIFDFAGNLAEWINEICASNPSQAIYRSIDYKGSGASGPAAYRGAGDGIYNYPNVGFRVVLYLD